MVADDMVVKAHGEENLDMHLLMLAHLVKKLRDWNCCIKLLLPPLIALFSLVNIRICLFTLSNSQSPGRQHVSRRECWRKETHAGSSENCHLERRGKVEIVVDHSLCPPSVGLSRSVGRSVGQLVGRSSGWSDGRSVDKLIERLIDRHLIDPSVA